MSSLPVPVSPVIRTVESVGPTLAIRERTAFKGLDVPTISSNVEALSISSRRATFLLLKFLFGSLALIDIRKRNIPTHDLSLVVVQRIETNQKPTIIRIHSPHSQLQLVRGANGASTIGKSPRRPFPVVRMNEREHAWTQKLSGCLPPLSKTTADVIEHNAIGTKTFTTRSQYHNLLGREVQHLP
jgi:hypothetical protein